MLAWSFSNCNLARDSSALSLEAASFSNSLFRSNVWASECSRRSFMEVTASELAATCLRRSLTIESEACRAWRIFSSVSREASSLLEHCFSSWKTETFSREGEPLSSWSVAWELASAPSTSQPASSSPPLLRASPVAASRSMSNIPVGEAGLWSASASALWHWVLDGASLSSPASQPQLHRPLSAWMRMVFSGFLASMISTSTSEEHSPRKSRS
mmetsp:Transcript_1025/g.3109  ORF Transcript_1025/g.3109 Transcript_1025/m.3109 type:complete len:214 (-) Transcript_1025:1484-2125(-)